MENPHDLGPVIRALDLMQAEGILAKYAIGGAFAAILHAEPISTIDFDVFFLFKEQQTGAILSLDKIYDFAKAHGYTFDHEFININGWLVQFVESSNNKLWLEAVENAETIDIGPYKGHIIDKEHLVAMWLFAGRAKDYQKIAMFVEADIITPEKLDQVLQRHNLRSKWEAEKWRFTDEN